jgi:hypothetical protein
LFSEVRWAEDSHACNFAAIQQFLGEERCFNGLSDTHVVSNQETHRILLEPHEQGDQLVGTRLEVQMPKRTERACASAKPKAQSIAKHSRGTVVSGLLWDGILELGRDYFLKTFENAGDLHVSAA